MDNIKKLSPTDRFPNYTFNDSLEILPPSLLIDKSYIYHIRLMSHVRKSKDDIYYLIPVIMKYDCEINQSEDKYLKIIEAQNKCLHQFIAECYKVLLFHIIDIKRLNLLQFADPYSRKEIIFIDEDQRSEEERLIIK